MYAQSIFAASSIKTPLHKLYKIIFRRTVNQRFAVCWFLDMIHHLELLFFVKMGVDFRYLLVYKEKKNDLEKIIFWFIQVDLTVSFPMTLHLVQTCIWKLYKEYLSYKFDPIKVPKTINLYRSIVYFQLHAAFVLTGVAVKMSTQN